MKKPKRVRRKARFRVRQKVKCSVCGTRIVTAVLWTDSFGYLYRLGREKFSESLGGHSEDELRPLSRRERGQ
ncbi:hypothetical protein LCGC14_2367010 [marine sediment metagenome]|uniref:Uncharacterized protein n=1 Tax=marine sediment metagenome TaxID=412755 RepID=A0A0F9CS65_9ZZZZ